MIVSPRAASSQMLAMLMPRMSALTNALSSNEPKNEPRAMRAPSHRCGTVGNGPRSRHLASPRPLRARPRRRTSDHVLANLAVWSHQAVSRAFAAVRIDGIRIRSHVLIRSLDDLEASVRLALADLGLQPGIEVLVVDPDQTFGGNAVFNLDAAGMIADRTRR